MIFTQAAISIKLAYSVTIVRLNRDRFFPDWEIRRSL